MKKFLAALLILVLLSTAPSFAAGNILPEAETVKAEYLSSTWINFDPEYAMYMVILTPYQDRAAIKYDISSIIKRQIENDLTETFEGIDEIIDLVKTETTTYKLKSIFDVTVTDTTVKLLDVKEGTNLKLHVNVGLKDSDPKPLVMHAVESKAGTWEALDDSKVAIHKDNTLTLYLDSFCPIIVLLPEEVSAPVVKDPEVVLPTEPNGQAPQIDAMTKMPTALLVIDIVSIIGLLCTAYVLNAKEKNKMNSRLFFALQRIKLNIEIFIAKNRAR